MTDKKLTAEAIVQGLDGADVFLRDLAGSTNTSLDEYAIGILFNIAYLCGDAADIINRQKAEIERLTKGIVRCADCQHCALDYADRGFGYPTKPIRVCIIHDHETTLDDYCSWARRKDGADNE